MYQNWRKGSRTTATGADCVEVARDGALTAVRDTKNRAGGVLEFGPREWARFAGGAKGGALDGR